MKKKILALCLVVVLAVTAVTGVTLAYFTDVSKEVTNTFTIGDVQIKLDEAPVDENTGKTIDGDRRTENTYKDIYPGQELDKDPMVTVMANSESSYVRMKVTANTKVLEKAFPEFVEDGVFEIQKLFVGYEADVWVYEGATANGTNTDETVYEFRYKEATTESEKDEALDPLFTQIKIPDDATSADLKALVGVEENGTASANNNFVLKIIAEAIQAEGFTNDDAAWAAFANANPQQAKPID